MYTEHFGLQKLPFNLTPDTQLFCEVANQEHHLDALHMLVENGEDLVKITGKIGTGKTMLCRLLLDKLITTHKVCYILNPMLSPEGLYHAIADELSIPLRGKQNHYQILSKINKHLIKHFAETGSTIVLIIDEAQTMPMETLEALRLLTNLETETTKLLQIILFGQEELDSKLAKPELRQLAQRVSFSAHTRTLTAPEVKRYISTRMVQAGHTSGDAFSAAAVQAVFRYSRGVPRVINILCHKSLLMAYANACTQVSKKDVMEAFADSRQTLGLVSVKSWKRWANRLGMISLGVLPFTIVGISLMR